MCVLLFFLIVARTRERPSLTRHKTVVILSKPTQRRAETESCCFVVTSPAHSLSGGRRRQTDTQVFNGTATHICTTFQLTWALWAETYLWLVVLLNTRKKERFCWNYASWRVLLGGVRDWGLCRRVCLHRCLSLATGWRAWSLHSAQILCKITEN